jgi:hypothetical protein
MIVKSIVFHLDVQRNLDFFVWLGLMMAGNRGVLFGWGL